jgi:hypothetical protein
MYSKEMVKGCCKKVICVVDNLIIMYIILINYKVCTMKSTQAT